MKRTVLKASRMRAMINIPIIFVMAIAFFLLCLTGTRNAFDDLTDSPTKEKIFILEDNSFVTQQLAVEPGILKNVILYFQTPENAQGRLTASLLQNGTVVSVRETNIAGIRDNEYPVFETEQSLRVSENDRIQTELKYQHESGEYPMIWLTEHSDNLVHGTEEQHGYGLAYRIRHENTRVRTRFTVFLAITIAVLAILLAVLVRTDQIHPVKMTVVLLLVVFCSGTLLADIITGTGKKTTPIKPLLSDRFEALVPGAEKAYPVRLTGGGFHSMFLTLAGDSGIRMDMQILDNHTGREWFSGEITPEQITSYSTTGKAVHLVFDEQIMPSGELTAILRNRENERNLILNLKESSDGNNSFNVFTERETDIGWVMTLSIFLTMGCMMILLVRCTQKGRIKPSSLFLILSVPLLVIYLCLFPAWSVPDGDAHAAEAYRWSNLLLGKGGEAEWTGRQEDIQILLGGEQNDPRFEDYAQAEAGFYLRNRSTEESIIQPVEYMNYYSIVNYLPQVLGLILGRLLGFSGFVTVLLARLLILLFYLFVCDRCIRMTPVGKSLFALIPLFPMCLMMGASFSYDAMVILSALALTAGFLRLRCHPEEKKTLLWVTVWAFIAGAVKGGGNLVLLLLAIPLFSGKDRGTWKTVAIPMAAGLVSLLLFDLVLPTGPLFQAGTVGDGRLTASFALSHPVDYLQMLVRKIFRDTDRMIINIGGTHLGWLEKIIPQTWIVCLLLITGLMSWTEQDELPLDRKDRKVFWIIVVGFCLLMPVMLLSYTPETADVLYGIQARYYLPILPLVGMLLTKRHRFQEEKKEIPVRMNRSAIYWIGALSCLNVLYLLSTYMVR